MKKSKMLFVFILIGIMASAILLFNRVNVESENKTIDITLDFKEIKELSSQSEEDMSWWFRKFNEWNVGSVTVNEETFQTMRDEDKGVEFELVGNIVKDLEWKEKQPEELVDYIEEKGIRKFDFVVTTNSESAYEFIKDGLKNRYDEEKYSILKTKDKYVFVLEGNAEDALYNKDVVFDDSSNKIYMETKILSSSKLKMLGLGYDEEKIKMIKDTGLDIILRPSNYNRSWTDEKYIRANFKEYEKFNIQPNYILFSGKEIVGYPENIALVKELLEDNNTKVGLIESPVQRGHFEQSGLDDLTRGLDYNAIRIFSVPQYVQERYKYYNYDGAEEIENVLYRAVTERNIRVIYFRPFKHNSQTYVTNPQDYEDAFQRFEERIGKHGMTLGEASVMRPNDVNPILKMLIGLGILGAGIILMGAMFDINRKLIYLSLILGIVGIIIVSLIAPFTSAKLFAFGAAIVFPTLSMVYLCSKLKDYYLGSEKGNSLRKNIIEGIKVLVIMVLISSIGAIFVGSLLSSSEYLLEMDIFRGVKLAQIVPILLYMIIFIGHFGFREDKLKDKSKFDLQDLKDILLDNIKILYVAMGVLLLGVGYIYLARTGHETNIQPSNLEMIGRNFLELKLLARPRNKEFLIAFPAIILVVYMGINKRKIEMFILGLFIIIGQTSIVNTFSHLRTPIYISVTRTFYGVVFGIILGILYLIMLDLGVKLFKTLKGELFNE